MNPPITQRLLTPFQKLFYNMHEWLDGEGTAVVVLDVAGPWDEARFRTVWNELQQAHPLMRCRIVEEQPGAPVLQLDTACPPIPISIQPLADERAWESVALRSVDPPFVSSQAPLCRLIVLPRPNATGFFVVITAHHVILDGISVLALAKEMLLRLAGRPTPEQPGDLELGHSSRLTATRWQCWHTIWRRVAQRWRYRQCKTVLFPDEVPSPGSFLHTRLSREQTSALLARCRAEQTTLLGALMAIALQTLADDQQWRQATQELMVLVNLRGFYAPPLPEWVLGSYVSRMKFWYTAPESLPLWDLARRCRQDVQDDLTPGLHASQDRILRWIRVTKQMLASGGRVTLGVNNLGRWESPAAEPYRLQAFAAFGLSRRLGVGVGLYALTIDGSLNLCWQADRTSRESLDRLSRQLIARIEHELASHPPAAPA